jgi:hypothetical protein
MIGLGKEEEEEGGNVTLRSGRRRRRGGGGGGGEEKRTAEFHSSQIPPCLFPRKKYLFFKPDLFAFCVL